MRRPTPFTIYAPLLWTCVALVGANLFAADQSHGCGESERLFAVRCGLCHSPTGIGTLALAERPGSTGGLLWERAAVTPLYLQTVVRTGVRGMPRVTRAELTDEEAERIAQYVTVCRRDDGKAHDAGPVHE